MKSDNLLFIIFLLIVFFMGLYATVNFKPSCTKCKKEPMTLQSDSSCPNMLVKKVMTNNPISIDKDDLAAKALSIMNSKKITSLCVHNKKNKSKTIGVLHIHNILQLNIS